MPISGKYNFSGIKKLGSAAIRAAFATSPNTAWLLKFGALTDLVLEFLMNWLANKGLIILNLGAIYVSGELDQRSLDSAMDDAIKEITNLGGIDKLTPEQKRAIDDKVIKAARKFIVIGKSTK